MVFVDIVVCIRRNGIDSEKLQSLGFGFLPNAIYFNVQMCQHIVFSNGIFPFSRKLKLNCVNLQIGMRAVKNIPI